MDTAIKKEKNLEAKLEAINRNKWPIIAHVLLGSSEGVENLIEEIRKVSKVQINWRYDQDSHSLLSIGISSTIENLLSIPMLAGNIDELDIGENSSGLVVEISNYGFFKVTVHHFKTNKIQDILVDEDFSGWGQLPSQIIDMLEKKGLTRLSLEELEIPYTLDDTYFANDYYKGKPLKARLFGYY